MSTVLAMFVLFIAITLGITYWAARLSRGTNAFFVANRQFTGWQNGIAIAGDYMSAASFLGIAGIIAFQGYDGFMYSVGWLVAYLLVLLVVVEPLRNSGKYTMADVLAYRLRVRPVRAMAALSTLTVSTFYMVAQMVGAGALVTLLLKGSGITYNQAVVGVGILMTVYVVFGGMLATTWVQIVKAVLLMGGTLLLSVLVLAHYGFDLGAFFRQATHVTYHVSDARTGKVTVVTKNFLDPGLRYHGRYGALDLISLGIALIFGTAGLPHILSRFYTVPDAPTARTSVVWAMVLIGGFYIMTTFLGFGAATILGPDLIAHGGGTNMSAPLLARQLGGDVFFAFISAIAFATILAVVAGLTISAATSVAHDFWSNVIRRGMVRDEQEEVRVARIAAFGVGGLSMLIAIQLGPTTNVAFLVSLAFAVAASANLPVIVFSLFWKQFNTAGAVVGVATGLTASILLILLSPITGGASAIFPLENPGIISVPLGFLGAYLGARFSREPSAVAGYAELLVRATTGIGAE